MHKQTSTKKVPHVSDTHDEGMSAGGGGECKDELLNSYNLAASNPSLVLCYYDYTVCPSGLYNRRISLYISEDILI